MYSRTLKGLYALLCAFTMGAFFLEGACGDVALGGAFFVAVAFAIYLANDMGSRR